MINNLSVLRIKPLPLASGHGRYITSTPERALVSVGEWPLHIAVINFNRFASETVTQRPFHMRNDHLDPEVVKKINWGF
jgi:hypothetical protein